MALQYSITLRNAQLDQAETTIGTSAILYLRSGAPPADCAAVDSGTLISTINLPADWMAAAASGAKAKSGTWQDASADNAGTLGHFRIKDSTGTTTHMQGTITATGGGGDMTVDNTSVTAGQQITINSFTLNAGNA